MNCWEVKDYLGELTDVTTYSDDKILSLCRSSVKEIESKLKPDTDKSDFRLVAAAAGLAYYKLTLQKIGADTEIGISKFKAGDVSIEQESKTDENHLENAKCFYENKMAEILPLCKDESFAFKQVKVM